MRNDYSNGRIFSTGKVVMCPGFNPRYPCQDSTCRKTGRWIYYYQNGNIKKIENYLRIKSCNDKEAPCGSWEYYSEQGALIKKDEYKNGILWDSEIARFYTYDQLAGEISVKNGVRDTIKYNTQDTSNLIINGDFNEYIGPPEFQSCNGQNEMGKQIPFWNSNDGITPDYYNPYRRLDHVPNNMDHVTNEKYSYVGIILYHQPTGIYNESITGMISSHLKPDQTYCLKIKIRLSKNAGFYVDRLGIGFTANITSTLEKPQIIFTNTLVNRDDWTTLCYLYIAKGNEKFITIGRNNIPNESTITPIIPINTSEGDYNRSAYYLIDTVTLTEVTSECNCLSEDGDNTLSASIFSTSYLYFHSLK
jgi:hypothetical protein